MDSTSPIRTNVASAMGRARRRRRTRSERLDVARALAASDLNVGEFAAKHGVTKSSLVRWRQELGRASATDNGSFVEISVPPEPRSVIEVITAGGHYVRVAPGFDEPTLTRLVRALQHVSPA